MRALQRYLGNTKEQNEQIQAGEVPQELRESPANMAQKETEARWTKKNNVSFFGYKNHAKVDSKSKLITDDSVTDASVHDSQQNVIGSF